MSEIRELVRYLWDNMNWLDRFLVFVLQPAMIIGIIIGIIVAIAVSAVKAARSDIPSHRCPVCNQACD